MSRTNEQSVTRYSRRRILSGAALAAMGLAGSRRADAFAAMRQNANSTPEPAAITSFLDGGIIHEISVSFDQNVYDAMIETLSDTGEKEWIEATVSIDGATYDTVGMRLKGNSSLGGLRGGMSGPIQQGNPSDEQGGPPPGEEESGEADEEVPEQVFNESSGAGANADANADEPERLPWLIRLDKYVDDQQHEGITELVIRSNRSQSALNEAVSLELLGLAGLATQRAAYVRFTVNGSAPALRLAIEHPNDAWMAAHFPADGFLYKAEAGGDYSYRGDDPASYKDIFDLEAGGTGDDATDMAPLFDFLDFLNNSDDDSFAAQIDERLDRPGLATYMAMMDLIHNSDDIDGPGNNSYLYAAPDTGQITIVPWDMNLAFGGPAGQFMIKDGGPEGMAGAKPPFTATPVAGAETPDDGPTLHTSGGGRPPAFSNILVERATADADFAALVDTTSSTLRAELFTGGVAEGILDRWVSLLKDQASDLVDEATITSESNEIAANFTQEP